MAQPTTAASLFGGANLLAAYKELFPDRALEQLAMMDRDLFKWVPKKDDLEGDGIHVPMRYAMGQGLSVNFPGMQASHTAGKTKRVFIERNRYYAGVSIDAEAIRAARSRKGAFFDMKEREIEDVTRQVTEELEKHLWRDGTAVKGTIGSITNANPAVITLTEPEDVANFSVGEFLECRDTTLATDRAGDEQIAGINYDAGTITMSSNVVTDHSWAATDKLIRGTNGAVASDVNAVCKGLAAWIPETAETSGTFLGMDRTDDVVRLQGFRQGYLGSIEETIKKLRSKMGRLGAKPDSIFVSHANWHRLELELGSRAIREDGNDASFGLPTLKYASPKGVMRVYAGAFCPENVGYLLCRNSWALHHLDGLPHIAADDGLKTIRGMAFDGITLRIRLWAELACDNLKDNGRFTIA